MGEERPRSAIVAFGSAAEAGRPVAGVAAAARIVRELAEAGFAEIWLVLPDPDRMGARASADLRRLCGAAAVRIAREPPALADGLRVPSDPLPGAAVRLDRTGATAAILAATAKASDGPVSRWLNRPVSRRLSALLLRIPGVRPIHATLGTALLALAMFAALVAGGDGGLVAGALLFQAASVFDGVDGEIARATFRASRSGAALDSAVDVATTLLLVIGLAFNLGTHGEPFAFALAGWGLGLFALGLAIIAWRAARARGPFSLDHVKHDYGRVSGRLVPMLLRFLTIVSSRDFFALLFALLILAGLPMGVLYLFAAAATVWILFVIGSIAMGRGSAVALPGA
jgi:phosphatidylglycerophosphate synthase